MTTGQRIKKFRKKIGMTQEELGAILGVSGSMIAQYETDKRNPKYETLKRIAAALGVEWTELVPESKQGAAIAVDVIKRAGLTLKSADGKIVHQGTDQKWWKMSYAEAYRAGILQFYSEGDRIVFFYNQLTYEDRIASGIRIFQHLDLDKDALSKVADYIMSLSESPLYQHTPAPESTPAQQEGKDTTPPPNAPETPPEGK